jgi:hypothetical protein
MPLLLLMVLLAVVLQLVGVSIAPQNSVLARVWSYIHNQKPQVRCRDDSS